MRRKRAEYFPRQDGDPEPIVVDVRCKARFSDTDPMGIVWYGRYPFYFEDGAYALGRHCGISYMDLDEVGIRAPIVECHIEYLSPIPLDLEFTVRTRLHWSEAAVLRHEFEFIRDDGTMLSRGYTVQMFISVDTGDYLAVSPEALVRFRKRWLDGEFYE